MKRIVRVNADGRFPLLKLNARQRTVGVISVTVLLLGGMLLGGVLVGPEKLSTNLQLINEAPSFAHPFGTDWIGRDMLARTLKGLALSFGVGTLAATISVIVALTLSLYAFLGKTADRLVTWLIDLFLSLPHLLALILIAFALGGGLKGVVIGIALTHWPQLARVLRAEVLQLRAAEYVHISWRLGKSGWWIGRRHIIPHLVPQLLVGFVLIFPHAILHEAAITFLGFGLSAQQPAIGIILSESMRYLSAGMWWLAFFPGLSLVVMVCLVNMLGKSIHTLIEPPRLHSISGRADNRSIIRAEEREGSRVTQQADDWQRGNILAEKKDAIRPPLLEVKNLSVSFTHYAPGLREKQLNIINRLDLSVERGEIVAVVGASGSGKSILTGAILGILPTNACVTGSILYNGLELTPEKLTHMRGKHIAFIPQSVNALDPLMTVGKQVRTAVKERDKKGVQRDIFAKMRLNPAVEGQYPFQISGGMARRVLVATAMASGAPLIVADEPTPNLDERVLSEMMDYLRQLADAGKGVILITHDMTAALKVADKIAVFYAGTIVEMARAEDFSGRGAALRHPYSQALWRALPENDFAPTAAAVPLPDVPLEGCSFEPRCPYATAVCREQIPEYRKVRGGIVRCFHA